MYAVCPLAGGTTTGILVFIHSAHTQARRPRPYAYFSGTYLLLFPLLPPQPLKPCANKAYEIKTIQININCSRTFVCVCVCIALQRMKQPASSRAPVYIICVCVCARPELRILVPRFASARWIQIHLSMRAPHPNNNKAFKTSVSI